MQLQFGRCTQQIMWKVKNGRSEKATSVLARMKEQDIDLSDIPEVKDWSKAVVGKFYRPIKKPLTIRIDAEVLAWLKGQGKGYQTKINGLLREAMRRARSCANKFRT